MRPRLFLHSSFLVFALFSPSLLFAQFQQPTAEELKMTSDPKAPGASAVYLNVEEVTDDPLHYHMKYVRIKVLQEKGKELATVQLPFTGKDSKVTDIKARTIHSDGTIVPLEGKLEDLLVAKVGDQTVSRKVINLPSVEVGSILEYRYQVRYDDNHYSSPYWEIQQRYFVHKAHYAFTPFQAFLNGAQNRTARYLVDSKGHVENTLLWTTLLPPGTKVVVDPVGKYTVDVEDIPPVPLEEWMPPIESFLYKVSFYYSEASNGTDFWVTEAKRWSKEVDRFAEPTRPIQDAVRSIVTPGDSELDKAKKLYKAVQALDNTDFSRARNKEELKQLGLHEAKRAEDTWAQKSGNSEDIALLYLAMLRAAGLTAWDMKVVDRRRGIFDGGYLNFDQLTDDIVILNTDGKEIVLDPGEKMCPFQTVSWRHSGATGIRQGLDGRSAASSPFQSYAANTLTRVGEVALDGHGGISGSFRFVMRGQEALRWRQDALRYDLDEVKKSFDRWLDSMVPSGVEAHVDHFLALDDPDVNLIAVIAATGSLGTATPKRLLLPGFFFQTRASHPFVDQEKRLEPVDMHYPDQVIDQVTFHLPPDLAVEGAPQAEKIPWAERAVLVSKTVVQPGQVIVARQFTRGFTVVKPDEYQGLHDFYQKVAAADQQQLVLIASSAVKGD